MGMLKVFDNFFRSPVGRNQPRKVTHDDLPAPVLRDTLTPSDVDAIIDRYSALLHTGVSEWREVARILIYPESLLPASREEIEESILRLGRKLHRNDQFTQDSKEILRHCYAELAHSVPDYLAERARVHSLAVKERRFADIARDNGVSIAVSDGSLKKYSLRREEFDTLVNEKIRLD